MFITRPEFSEWLPPFKGYENATGWFAVELVAALPWFLLEVQLRGQRGAPSGSQTFCLSSMRALADSLAGIDAKKRSSPRPFRITAFYPPGWPSSNSRWRNLEISEIWDAQLRHEGSRYQAWLVRTCTGEELIEPAGITAESVTPVSMIYSAPNPA